MSTRKELEQELERAISEGQDVERGVHVGSPSTAANIRAAIAAADYEPEPEPERPAAEDSATPASDGDAQTDAAS